MLCSSVASRRAAGIQEEARKAQEAKKLMEEKRAVMMKDDEKDEQALLLKGQANAEVEKPADTASIRSASVVFLHTIALCLHSLTEGVAMGSALYCKYSLRQFLNAY